MASRAVAVNRSAGMVWVAISRFTETRRPTARRLHTPTPARTAMINKDVRKSFDASRMRYRAAPDRARRPRFGYSIKPATPSGTIESCRGSRRHRWASGDHQIGVHVLPSRFPQQERQERRREHEGRADGEIRAVCLDRIAAGAVNERTCPVGIEQRPEGSL